MPFLRKLVLIGFLSRFLILVLVSPSASNLFFALTDRQTVTDRSKIAQGQDEATTPRSRADGEAVFGCSLTLLALIRVADLSLEDGRPVTVTNNLRSGRRSSGKDGRLRRRPRETFA